MNEGRYGWQEDAACRGIEPEIFFPISDEEAGPAKAICGGCVAQQECLVFSFQNKERYGVWGGVTEKERIEMARRGVAQRMLEEALSVAG
ncbi:MAG: WhiB family transcriptional regulator [Actinomycetota bacterium]|nr:WhiB family transcriptional regulator [Actinomycetota bacterium]